MKRDARTKDADFKFLFPNLDRDGDVTFPDVDRDGDVTYPDSYKSPE